MLFWPTKEEKAEIKARIKEAYGFPDCIGFIDGTLIPLYKKPNKDGMDYYSYKGRYGLAAMAVCDDKKRIRYAFIGFPGCAQDQRVLYATSLYNYPNIFFDGQKYVLGDSGYTPDPTLIPMFKGTGGRGNNDEEEKFNGRMKNARVTIEHCFGMLKGRCQSLRELRKDLRTAKDVEYVNKWFTACCILHNLLIDADCDEFHEDYKENDDDDLQEALRHESLVVINNRKARAEAGKEKRLKLMHIVNGL